jgi:VanZ family protein
MVNRGAVKIFALVSLAVLTFVALGPAAWQPRSGIGWELDHFAGYFAFTILFCIAWPRPLLVGAALTLFAVTLELLQGLMPDRSSYYLAAVYSACGVISAALISQLFMLAYKRFWERRKT